jgi:hypothetical protein
LILVTALIAALAITPAARALPLLEGFDLFSSPAGLSSATIPGVGLVTLQGVPFDPLLGDTDTIVRRTNPVGTVPCVGSPIDPGCPGAYDIELVALYLRSVAPVDVGGSFFDVFVTIDTLGLPGIPQYDSLLPSVGELNVLTHDDTLGIGGGGTFDSTFFDVFANIIVTTVGGDPRNPADVVDSFVHQTGPMVTLAGVWSHTPRLDDPRMIPDVARRYPAGNFYPGVDPVTGGKVLTPEEAALARHGVLPGQVPEPGSLLLFGGGLLALASVRRFRRRIRN